MDLIDWILMFAPAYTVILFWLGYYLGFKAAKKETYITAKIDQLGWWR